MTFGMEVLMGKIIPMMLIYKMILTIRVLIIIEKVTKNDDGKIFRDLSSKTDKMLRSGR